MMKDKTDQSKVIEGKTRKAAALHYDGQNTPKLIAKGQGKTAEEIIDIAEQHQIFLHQDPVLTDVLNQLELGEQIPETLYIAVAQIIAFAYSLQDKIPEKIQQNLPQHIKKANKNSDKNPSNRD